MLKKLAVLAVVALALVTFGCGGGGSSGTQTSGTQSAQPAKPATDPSKPAMDPGKPAMFAEDIQPIFTKNCAHPSCHGQAKSADMQLTKGMAYDNIVNVKSTEDPKYMRIKPSMPDSSYLVLKIEGKQPVGARMPLTGGYLSDAQIATIRSWVTAGAKND
jgi:hypothetical protein